jgi:hypothetical protein
VSSSGQLDRRTVRWQNGRLCGDSSAFQLPDNVSDETAALPNPGVSAGVDTQQVPIADVEKAWQGEPQGNKRRSTMYCDNPFLFLSVLSAGPREALNELKGDRCTCATTLTPIRIRIIIPNLAGIFFGP